MYFVRLSRIVLALLVLVIFGNTLAQELEGELTVAVQPWLVDKFNMEELAQRFEADHPNVEVEVITFGLPLTPTFLEWTQTGDSTADLYFGGQFDKLAPAVINDLLLPWDDIMVGELAPENWYEGFLNPVEGVEGNKYPVIPGLGEVSSFQYNVKYAQEAGYEVPVTPDTYTEILNFICDLDELDGVTGAELHLGWNFSISNWQAAVYAMTGTTLDEAGRPDWDSDASRVYHEFLKEAVDRGCSGTLTLTDTNAARNGLKSGAVAVANEASSRANEASVALCPEQETPCASGQRVRQFPYPGDAGGTLGFTHNIFIPRVADRPDLARAFTTEQLLSEYAQTWSAEHYGKLPTLQANFAALPQDNPNFGVLAPLLDNMGPAWTFRDSQFLRDVYADQLALYIVGDISLDEMFDNLNRALDEADLTTISESRTER